MNRILNFVFLDIIKNRIVLIYGIVLAVLSWSVFALESSSNKGVLTMLNVILLVVPLVSIMFTTIYLYNTAEFIELMLSQPIQRKTIWISLFQGISISMVLTFLLSAGVPLILFANKTLAIYMIINASLISVIFVALAFLATVMSRDKAKGIGISLITWIYFALIFDGLIMFLLFQFSEYPIEKPMVLLSATSPLDLGRILILLKLDASSMMGYTGAIFKSNFGSQKGILISLILLILWIIVPFYISLRIFEKKDI